MGCGKRHMREQEIMNQFPLALIMENKCCSTSCHLKAFSQIPHLIHRAVDTNQVRTRSHGKDMFMKQIVKRKSSTCIGNLQQTLETMLQNSSSSFYCNDTDGTMKRMSKCPDNFVDNVFSTVFHHPGTFVFSISK